MLLIDRWIARGRRRTDPVESDHQAGTEIASLSKAHGIALALIAVILDREDVIASSDFAEFLAGLATVTAIDQPDAGAILSLWATSVRDAASVGYELPSVQ